MLYNQWPTYPLACHDCDAWEFQAPHNPKFLQSLGEDYKSSSQNLQFWMHGSKFKINIHLIWIYWLASNHDVWRHFHASTLLLVSVQSQFPEYVKISGFHYRADDSFNIFFYMLCVYCCDFVKLILQRTP